MSVREVKCPRWGRVRLNTRFGASYVVQTVCKTWGCLVCRFKRASYIKGMMARGFLIGGDFFLITLTLRLGRPEMHDADFVNRAWTRLLRQLKKKHPKLTWFKVIEATKKGTPHLHVLMSGLGVQRRDNPHKDHFGNTPYGEGFIGAVCDCVLHEVGKLWFKETTAFVTDAAKVFNPAGACRYLAKYLVKGFIDRTRLEELGYGRRYSMARNWDRGEKLQLRGSKEDIWESIEIIPRWYREEQLKGLEEASQTAYFCESVGDLVSLEIVAKNRRRMKLKKVEGLKDAVFPAHARTSLGIE